MISISDRLADLGRRLSPILDVPDNDELENVLIAAGWEPSTRRNGHRTFQLDGMLAGTRAHHGGAEIIVDIRDFGDPQDVEREEYANGDHDTVSAQLYEEARALADSVAGELALDPAGPFDLDPLEGWHFDPHLFRAGHWVVAVADVQQDSDLPLIVEAHFAWGADLPGRLTGLVPPPARPPSIDWAAITRPLPADYRWLVDTYGPGPLGGYLDLIAPDQLPASEPGPLLAPDRLTMATTSDGATVSWLMQSTRPWETDPDEEVNSWSVMLSRPGYEREHDCGLLRFLVLALTGKHEPAVTG
ncbi:hypothetical protein AB0G04_17975 [Actinoplanes sp. NPDC023801]|uniref:hypothetical protein n=1 Tax=Actinoplanes sp. NPDC023801 TaxID=3154595 RepID=UPI0034058F10